MMVSDAEIVMRIMGVLQNADLTTTTTAAIRRQLEEDLGTDLTEKKAFIREQVDIYLQAQQQQHQQHQHHLYLQTQQQYLHSLQQQQQQQQQQPFLQAHYFAPNYAPPQVVEDDADVDEDNAVPPDPEPEPEPRRLSHAKTERAKKDGPQKEKKKRTGGGLNKLCDVSPELRAIIGDKELTRTQVVKELWIYIREKNLQDPENRRKIVCNDALRSLLGCESTDMFKMNKLLARHIITLENPVVDGEEPKPKRSKPDKKEGSENEGGKARVSGFTAPHPISEALMNFLGTSESELSRSEVTKRIWEYIKGNQLQDPADKRRIICDSKLQDLFGCDSFHGFGMAKYLSPHFIKG